MKGPSKDDSLFRRSHPIHFAAANGASDEVKKIIEEGGETALHAKTGLGQNAAHCAASAGHQGVLVVLAEADPSLLEERDVNGATPMHSAAETGKLGALYFLALRVPDQVLVLNRAHDESSVTLSAQVSAKDKQGRRPVECATCDDCVAFLRSREYK